MSADDTKALLEGCLTEVWTEGNADAIESVRRSRWATEIR
ncbi:MAG: hypothetical protein BMS9Abin07_0613 [Acidimicrobiia bacterium]|nr:MAG: hypothetical protein BMS9Abin07_0613 [Acidimicrobiia bacterium]